MNTSLRGKVVSGLIWSSAANWGQSILSLLAFMAFAHLLGPHDLGMFAAVMVVIAFLQMFAEQGLSEAIVQRPEITPGVLNAVAIINFGLAVLIVVGMWFAAPFIAYKMGITGIVDVLRVVAVSLLVSALTFAQQAMLRRNFNYRWLSICTLVSVFTSGAVGVGFALAGMGVWSLVAQALSSVIVSNLMIWSKPQWKFRFEFDFRGVIPLVSFGSKRLATNLLEVVSTRYIEIFIAASLGAVALGLYTVAVKIYQAAMQMVGGTVLNVVLNGFSRLAHDRVALNEAYYRAVAMMTSTVGALFVFGALIAPELIRVLFGEKFTISATMMTPIMLWGSVQAVMWCTGTALNAIGRPDISLWISFLRISILLPTLWLLKDQNLINMVYGFIGTQFTIVPVSLLMAKRILNISILRLLKTMAPFVIALIITAMLVYGIRHIDAFNAFPYLGRLIVLMVFATACYSLIVYIIAKAHVLNLYTAIRFSS
jgi:O-antigen/teichoic acid export membrane protein